MILNKYALLLLISFFSISQSLTAQGNTYYVTPSGKSSNNGRSESAAWNWQAAVDRVRAGDLVHVKAGNYNVSGLWFKNSGTSSNPIVFRGYTSNPGDISSKPYGTMNYGNSIGSIGFPVIRPTNSNDSYAIFVGGNYIQLHNIGFSDPNGRVGYAVLVQGNNNKLDNLAFADLSLDSKGFTGSSVYIRGSSNTVTNSYGENSAYAFIFIHPHTTGKGNNNVIKHNEYRNDDTSRQTDYYLTTRHRGTHTNTSANNLFENNRAYRMHNGSHEGHGLANAGGRNNVWRNNTMYRSMIEVRYPSSSGTIFEGNKLLGNSESHVTFQNGATNITLRNNYLECDHAALNFIVKSYNPRVSTVSPHNIKIYNNIFKGGKRVISFGEGGYETTVSKNIDIYNNVFDGQSEGIRYYNNGTSMKFKNNVVINSTSKKWATISSGSISIDGDNNIFHNNSFTTPTSGFSSTKNTNPLFTNSGSEADRYKLKPSSPAINAGVGVSWRSIDFSGKSLVSSPDIGPHEYQGSESGNNNNTTTTPTCAVIPEYSLNGIWKNGQTSLNVADGTSVTLSMLPNGVGLTIKLPNGQLVGDNYKLGQVTSSDSGAYLLTSEDGCQTTLNLTVGNSENDSSDKEEPGEDPDNNNPVVENCPSSSITPEYSLNGSWKSGQNSLNLAEGTSVVLSMLPNGKDLTITLPNGSKVGDNHKLGRVSASDSGIYVLTSEDGCQTTLNLTVGDGGNSEVEKDESTTTDNCPAGNIIPEYNIGGVWGSGQNSISVTEGKAVTLSMLPNGVDLTVRLPNGTTVGDNYKLSNLRPEDSGVFILTSEHGCQTSVNLTVIPKGTSLKMVSGINSNDEMTTTSDSDTSKVSVYPNPVRNIMNVTLPINSEYSSYGLFTLSGTMIQQGQIDSNQTNFNVDVTGAPKGLLLLNVIDKLGNGEFIKIIKQ